MSEIVTESVEFTGSEGHALSARIDRPAQGPVAGWAVFAHCFACGKDFVAARRISRALADRGLAVLRFDFTGLGSPDGELAATTFSSNVADLVAGADWLRKHHQGPRVLVGHSLGGAAVLAAAGEIPEVTAIATVGAPADPAHVRRQFDGVLGEIEDRGSAEIELGGQSLRIGREFLDDIERWDLLRRVGRLGRALLIFHAPLDAVVPIEHARRLFEAAKHPKSFVSLDDADHLLGDAADAEYLAAVLDAWVSRYIERPEADRRSASPPAPGVVRVAENGLGPLAQEVHAGGHRLAADEPREHGGSDTGPSPYDYLLAGLGACTSMTLRLYAERKALPLERVSVELHHERVHAEDCATCEHESGRLELIHRRISLIGELTGDQRRRLLEIADRCPVHRTLTGPLEIHTRETD